MPGKTLIGAELHALAGSASMRPQRNAGENEHAQSSIQSEMSSFNEAPAKCRGKPLVPDMLVSMGQCASMRPQRNAGENSYAAFFPDGRFEASMRPQRNAGENARMNRRSYDGMVALQ